MPAVTLRIKPKRGHGLLTRAQPLGNSSAVRETMKTRIVSPGRRAMKVRTVALALGARKQGEAEFGDKEPPEASPPLLSLVQEYFRGHFRH